MTIVRLDEDHARTVANIILGTAALGAAVVILRTPTLRRLAFGLARTAVTVSFPAWLSQQVQTAWAEAGTPSSATHAPGTDRSGQLL